MSQGNRAKKIMAYTRYMSEQCHGCRFPKAPMQWLCVTCNEAMIALHPDVSIALEMAYNAHCDAAEEFLSIARKAKAAA